MLTAEQLSNLATAAAAAVAAEQETGCPADLTIAQWALESGWGEKMPQGSNNPFGIKARSGEASVDSTTTEYVKGEKVTILQKFKVYASLAEAFVSHGYLITLGRPYEDAWSRYENNENLVELVKGVAQHYSTTPASVYAGKLMEILITKPVQDALKQARGAAQVN